MFVIIILIWIECIILTSFPFLGSYGEFGFDPLHGKCHLVECDSESGKIKPTWLINTLGVSIPFLIVIISYSAVFLKLKQPSSGRPNQDMDPNNQYKISTIVLTACYFVFILPIYIIEFIPVSPNKVRNLQSTFKNETQSIL